MKVYNEQGPGQLHNAITASLEQLQQERGFDALTYIDQKADVLNTYMGRAGLSGCVVGVSGGVDSAVVLALAHAAAQAEDSPITTIAPVLMPILKEGVTTNQPASVHKGRELCNMLGLTDHVVDLTASYGAMKEAVDNGLDVNGEGWAAGQLVSYLRTPALYYTTSLLAQEGTSSIVLGTTNLDEGGYLGFFGKASDGMVDVQLISDLHKSEVFKVADELHVPQSITGATPNGDMYDGRSDEEVFGAPYEFVEFYQEYLNLPEGAQAKLRASWPPAAAEQFEDLQFKLEKLHSYNAHKYNAKSPAIHLDVYNGAVKGGWNNVR
jgi:NAD+ synthase (glutamine-hydrolysing)